MKTLILSSYSDKIAELNELTAPNKQAYADKHGYEFRNEKLNYYGKNHVKWLNIIKSELKKGKTVFTMGCDTIFTNMSISVDDKIDERYALTLCEERISWWPINNDVCAWSAMGDGEFYLIDELISSANIWLHYPWLWQNHLWNLIQNDLLIRRATKILPAREMNSTFQPYITSQGKLHRIPGPSSWQLGDWILHALDMPLEQRIDVIKWGLKFAGNGTYNPHAT